MKIPFHIVSGFLGSGKTTFLKRIIESCSDDLRPGIIQNEFAPSGIDGAELKRIGRDFDLLEINKGSVFCACLLGDFTRLLEKFIDIHQPGVIILEASGLSDTTAVAEVISSGKLAEKIFLATNWCIIDALNFSKTGLMRQRVEHQIRMADVVLLNKVDLLEDSSRIEHQVKSMNPFAEIKSTVYCNTDFELGEGALSKFYHQPAMPLERPSINSMVIKSGRKTTLEKAMWFLREWAPKAYRIKGYINLMNGKCLAVQCVLDTVNCTEINGTYYSSELIALTDQFTLREWNNSFKTIT
ncbi:MAG: CobW family GTP-binding protein [Mariniphaga sp.]